VDDRHTSFATDCGNALDFSLLMFELIQTAAQVSQSFWPVTGPIKYCLHTGPAHERPRCVYLSLLFARADGVSFFLWGAVPQG
jgi:hypothetical protein